MASKKSCPICKLEKRDPSKCNHGNLHVTFETICPECEREKRDVNYTCLLCEKERTEAKCPICDTEEKLFSDSTSSSPVEKTKGKISKESKLCNKLVCELKDEEEENGEEMDEEIKNIKKVEGNIEKEIESKDKIQCEAKVCQIDYDDEESEEMEELMLLMKEKCAKTEECSIIKSNFDKCMDENSSEIQSCSEDIIDYTHCINKCVIDELFKKLKPD